MHSIGLISRSTQLRVFRGVFRFSFSFSSVALLVSRVFPFQHAFQHAFQQQKKRHREGHATPFHTLVPRSSLAVPGTPSATSPRSQFVGRPWLRSDTFSKTGPLAPCATEPLTGDLDSVGSVDFFLFSLLLVLPLWQLLVFLVSCFLCCYFGSCFVCLFRQRFPFCFGCVIRVVYGIWLRVWTHVRVRGWIGRKLATCVDACHVAS